MNYIEFNFKVTPLQPASDILLAELGELGFDSFVETEDGLQAYILEEYYKEDLLKYVFVLNNPEFEITYNTKTIEQVNWNAEWEKNFTPIVVSDNCRVRAPFHDKGNEEYDIIIEPKMSFGTGHHATTHMMIQHILKDDFIGKKVLDMGCGTAVLAILAEMRGAGPLDAIDIDEWCYLNSIENAERNNCTKITVEQGDASLLSNRKYDIIIANINRNILLNDMKTYANCLSKDGVIYLSGFYEEDLDLIKSECTNQGLTYVNHYVKDQWVAAKFIKD
ncbi:50S ribosomal protein L11 methyltransferase [Croceibacter atlanticus]|jgi:ribosomal protein L11 methyltransferase|uniref:Ribosomal protein L11 methyltransferase n=1 Tax=Croceibacter atlanticus (strain ATCC BAA-628 / JCM 21780 / CIP 108009 / IAM 15332 / KCTC 12090 / HTCC2559) TaxID=216432 RepID=A3UB68_CROAH|nr:50S ribosomal protein L11 methyltransferase [Croceibacter atlanticus]EAP87054.1 putative ribosomal protein L11 methyltransferase [Croceibacter atlanticus HTCC2559]MBW4971255.1 50S ribosomal protein L11 methyltransferase [Croceibacter atlanticus]WSP34690.1 50S ribosomal protein L11 methyltransferase [Croceibacter atlanticus]